ncbi:hypothetical protein ID866_9866 [Astraeus odoratus]|nr:hypothetical protein ID866_9866 [Astraeus odoratus]
MDTNLVYAPLCIFHIGLEFNICKLDTSYLCNSEITDLEERIAAKIFPPLSYSYQFWMKHSEISRFSAKLAVQVKGICGSDKMLFWLGVLNAWGSVGQGVQSIAQWSR